MKISNSQYAKILYSMVDGKKDSEVDKAVLDFSKFIFKKKGSKKTEKIIASFSKIWNAKKNVVDCEILSAEPVMEESVKKIKDYVMKKYDAGSVSLKSVVKKDLKGGVVIRVKDEIIDASIDGQLKKLKKQLVS